MAQFVPKTASQLKNVPAGNIAATNVQAAINELDTEKASAIVIQSLGVQKKIKALEAELQSSNSP